MRRVRRQKKRCAAGSLKNLRRCLVAVQELLQPYRDAMRRRGFTLQTLIAGLGQMSSSGSHAERLEAFKVIHTAGKPTVLSRRQSPVRLQRRRDQVDAISAGQQQPLSNERSCASVPRREGHQRQSPPSRCPWIGG
jgi:hypothetical protein